MYTCKFRDTQAYAICVQICIHNTCLYTYYVYKSAYIIHVYTCIMYTNYANVYANLCNCICKLVHLGSVEIRTAVSCAL